MTITVSASLERGEEWWRVLSTAKKAAILKPYFDADRFLPKRKLRKRNLAIAEELQIHLSSVALQRSRYDRQKEEISREERESFEEKYDYLVDYLTGKLISFILPESEHRGVPWWTSLTTNEKKDAIRPLVEAGMSTSAISTYLRLGSRNRVAGVRDRMTYPNRVRGAGSGERRRSKIPAAKRAMWSLDALIKGDSKTTWHEFTGAEDPGFAQVELRLLLQALLNKNKIPEDVVVLIQQLKMGDDLEDEEYRRLASTIRQHPDLMGIAEHL